MIHLISATFPNFLNVEWRENTEICSSKLHKETVGKLLDNFQKSSLEKKKKISFLQASNSRFLNSTTIDINIRLYF